MLPLMRIFLRDMAPSLQMHVGRVVAMFERVAGSNPVAMTASDSLCKPINPSLARLFAQGQGLGGQLLLAAGRRCLRVASEVGGTMMLIDAKNETVAAWYASYGALALLDAPLTLLLPLDLVGAAIRAAGHGQ